MVMHKVVVKHEKGRKNWADQFLKPAWTVFLKILVWDQNFSESPA